MLLLFGRLGWVLSLDSGWCLGRRSVMPFWTLVLVGVLASLASLDGREVVVLGSRYFAR